MKFSKAAVLLSASLLASPLISASTQPAKAAQLGVVRAVAKATMIFSSPTAKQSENQSLAPGSAWKYFKVEKVNGETWYNLGGNQWVEGSQVNVVDNTQPVVTHVSNDLHGVATVTYRTPIVVWARPGAEPTKRYLPRFSAWKYFKVATTEDGENWYNLGGSQWIPQKYVDYGQDPHIAHFTPVIRKGAVATVGRGGARIYRGKGTPAYAATGRVLPAGSRWRVFDDINYGVLMYNLGGQQWVRADQVSLSN